MMSGALVAGTMSVRMLWPYMRLLHDFGPELAAFRAAGIDAATLADTDARVPRRLVGDILAKAAQRASDPALGLHAAELLESGDFGVMDHAVRACPDVRRALLCIARYTRLQDDNLEMHLVEEGPRAVWELRNVVPPALRLTNDFQVTASFTNLSRRLGLHHPSLEIHFRHAEATDAAEYARVFRAPVFLGKRHNALVFPRSLLDQAVPSANPDVFTVFDAMASRMLNDLTRVDTTTDRVRRLILNRIGRENIGISTIAGQLHMSEATLRRRLDDELITYKDIVDDLRRDLAARYITEPRVAIGEIAFLLGFSTQSAFGRAFRRWHGVSPLEYRSRSTVTRRAS